MRAFVRWTSVSIAGLLLSSGCAAPPGPPATSSPSPAAIASGAPTAPPPAASATATPTAASSSPTVAPSASQAAAQPLPTVFAPSKRTVDGKSLSVISKADLLVAIGRLCPKGFRSVEGIGGSMGRWENIGIHCAQPRADGNGSDLSLSVEIVRPRPVAQMEQISAAQDAMAGPHKRFASSKQLSHTEADFDEPAGVFIAVGTSRPPGPQASMAALVKGR